MEYKESHKIKILRYQRKSQEIRYRVKVKSITRENKQISWANSPKYIDIISLIKHFPFSLIKHHHPQHLPLIKFRK